MFQLKNSFLEQYHLNMSAVINENFRFLLNVLVCIAWRVHLFPFRTQKLSSTTSMVLRGFTWESRYMPRHWGEIFDSKILRGFSLIFHNFPFWIISSVG